MTASYHAQEIADGRRFEFGANWRRFLSGLNESAIVSAEHDLQAMLGVTRLDGLRFLDIGSGSGLSSLAARRLGATVHSFDYDPQSVACTRSLRGRYFPGDADWTIEEGSALDADYLRSLGEFDIVYSWGVLHHIGAMWRALSYSMIPLADEGRLFVAIYNHQLTWTRLCTLIKRAYNAAPAPGKAAILGMYTFGVGAIDLAKDIATLRNPLARYRTTYGDRGMRRWRDIVDWVGGYPFETARPDEMFDFYRVRGCSLERMVTGGGHACNQFVFRKTKAGQRSLDSLAPLRAAA